MNKKIVALALRDAKDKTVLVQVSTLKRDPLYQKRFTQIRKMLVHTELEVKKGDRVTISEQRPISKQKSWQVLEVIKEKGQK